MTHIRISEQARHERVRRGFVDYVRLYDSWRGPEHHLPTSVLEWGINDERTEYVPFWRNPYVTSEDPEVLVSMWKLPDRVLLSVFNYNGKQAKDVALKIDLDRLNLVPQLPWQEFIRVSALESSKEEPAPQLNFYARQLTVPALAPHTGRLVGVRRY
jgi:hypothetical protein